jgi:hypothetical protein
LSVDDARLLRLGDYVKCSVNNKSDEYYMVTGIDVNFKLRRVGNKELIILETAEELKDFVKINTQRA